MNGPVKKKPKKRPRFSAKNAKNDELRAIHDMVRVVKQDAEVSKGYMKIYEKERVLKEQGREEGRAYEIIHLFQEMGKSKEDIIGILMSRLDVSQEEAIEYYNKEKMD